MTHWRRQVGRRLPSLSGLRDALRRPPKRRPTADELMAMDKTEFRAFVRSTGLEARISHALRDEESNGS